jgi:hypothetical protein
MSTLPEPVEFYKAVHREESYRCRSSDEPNLLRSLALKVEANESAFRKWHSKYPASGFPDQ